MLLPYFPVLSGCNNCMGFNFKDTLLSNQKPPILIAEAGVGHFGSLKKAYELIDLAKDSGCQTIKFQHFSIDDLINESDLEWRERLVNKETSFEFIENIYQYALKKDIHCFFTPHTEKALDDLIELGNTDIIKIGSGERGNLKFIEKTLSTGAFVLISTGMYEDQDLIDLRELLIQYPKNSACILHCNTIYPTPYEHVNLKTVNHLKSIFQNIAPIGYSDHTEGFAVPLSSVALGVRVIEKHISLQRNIPNAQDWKVSCFKDDLPYLVNSIKQVWEATKDDISKKELTQKELSNRKWANKSCYLKQDIYPQTIFTSSLYEGKRPFNGLTINQVENNLLGKTYNGKEILKKGHSLNQGDLKLFD